VNAYCSASQTYVSGVDSWLGELWPRPHLLHALSRYIEEYELVFSPNIGAVQCSHLAGFPFTSVTQTRPTKTSSSPLPPLLDWQIDITVMVQHLLTLLDASLSPPLVLPISLPTHSLAPRGEGYFTSPLPSQMWIAAVIHQAPIWMHRTDFWSSDPLST